MNKKVAKIKENINHNKLKFKHNKLNKLRKVKKYNQKKVQ